MRKSFIAKIFSCVISVMILSSCSVNVSEKVHSFIGNLKGSMIHEITQSDEDKINEKFEQLIAALEGEDADAVRDLFSKNVVDEVEGFDDSIEELIEFYNGNLISYDLSGPHTSKKRHDGITVKYIENSYDIETSEDKYRIAFRMYIKDDTDPDNVGISSFSIIRTEDCPYKRSAYWGDGFFSPGIHFNKIYMETEETTNTITD